MVTIALIAAGGFVGGVIRHLIVTYTNSKAGVALANMAATFILALLVRAPGLPATVDSDTPLNLLEPFVAFGLAAALSTWSSFAAETGKLIKAKKYRNAVMYVLVVSAGCLWMARLAGLVYAG